MQEPARGPAVLAEQLCKRYGRLRAVDHLDLSVEPGEIFGFLGLNGAGKTTTIKILLDLRRPTAGRAAILGHDCQRDHLAARRQIGYLPGELGYYGDMTGLAVLDLLGRLSGQPINRHHRQSLLERLELTERDLGKRLRDFSSGMKRKLGIVQAFQADPPVLILDEPTEGLDPIVQEAFYELLAESRRGGRTVFMSSHVLSEVERVCDRIAVIRSGRLALVAPVAEVKRLAGRRVRVAFAHDVALDAAALPHGIEVASSSPTDWSLLAHGEIGPLIARLASLPVRDLHVDEARLEDVLIRFYREEAP